MAEKKQSNEVIFQTKQEVPGFICKTKQKSYVDTTYLCKQAKPELHRKRH